MDIIKASEQYLYFIKINRTKGSYSAEHDAIVRFLKYAKLNNIIQIKKITQNEIIKFVKACKEKGNSNKTINKTLSTMKRVLKYNKIKNKAIFEYPKLIEEHKHYDCLSDSQISKLNKYLKSLNKTETNLRTIIIIRLLIDTGARASELLEIKLQNINLKQSSILLEHTKKHRERYVFFTPETKLYLIEYIKKFCDQKFIYLFVSRKDKTRLKYKIIDNTFKKIQKKLNFKKFHAHMLRHTNATLLACGGLNEFELKELLGHSSISTTQIYIHSNKKLLQKKFKEAFKKGNEDNNY